MRGRITNEGEITEAANVELAASVILNSLVLRLWLQNFDFQIGILWHLELAFLVGKPQVWLTFPYITLHMLFAPTRPWVSQVF